MDIALITLLIVIYYKARKGEYEGGLIKAARIIGFIYLPIAIIASILGIIFLTNELTYCISLIITVVLLIIVIRIKKIAEKAMYRDDEWR